MKKLLIRTGTALVFATVILGSFFVPTYLNSLLFFALMLLGFYECMNMLNKTGFTPHPVLTYLPAIFGFAACHLTFYPILCSILIAGLVLSVILLPVIELFKNSTTHFTNVATALFPSVWIALPFGLVGLIHQNGGTACLVAIFIIIWIYDSVAYLVGSAIGNHKLCERISPKKSVEGFVGGLILTCGLSTIFVYVPYFRDLFPSMYTWWFFSFLIIIFSTFGDLVESLFKREAQIKDSGTILPGHGGILDRFDSFFFALPPAIMFLLLMKA